MPDSTQSSDGVITRPSSKTVAQTIDGLRRLMADRGFTVFNVIDHSGVAGRAGVQMPDSKLVMFGKPAVGAAVMVAAPLAALDIPLKVLVWEDRNGAVSVSYNSPGFLAGRHHLEDALRAPFDAVESIVEALPGALLALIRAGDGRSEITAPHLPIRASAPTPRSGPRPTPDSAFRALFRLPAENIQRANVSGRGSSSARRQRATAPSQLPGSC
jgi:uncharacterized protein (DUF302 family)